jgi:hypothetical protein
MAEIMMMIKGIQELIERLLAWGQIGLAIVLAIWLVWFIISLSNSSKVADGRYRRNKNW